MSNTLEALGGTVTIDIDEFRTLVEHNAYFNVIMALGHDPRTYILNDVCSVVDILLNKPVITAEEGC